jgi:membrane-bound inhibitor of C-type lysozyme
MTREQALDRRRTLRSGIMTNREMMLAGLGIAGLLAGPAYGEGLVETTATYTCADGKSIVAVYAPDEVVLTFGDGRKLALPQVISGSGTRYANADESMQFWSKGKMAFVTEGSDDNITYKDCVAD